MISADRHVTRAVRLQLEKMIDASEILNKRLVAYDNKDMIQILCKVSSINI